MSNLFSVNNVAFTIFGYPMSYIELVGTLLYLWSVWLIAQKNILTWPIGIVSVLFYMSLFYQIHLYSDALEQVYYLGASAYGWWHWSRIPKEHGKITSVQFSSQVSLLVWLVVTLVLGLLAGTLMSRIHLLLPKFFTEPASYPYVDALTTVGSFTAMWLMARRRVESWVYWIVIDVVGIVLYYLKEVKFVSLLYVLLLALAMKGLWGWLKTYRAAGPITTVAS
jgi:nicotinamide mononucleotide transporter